MPLLKEVPQKTPCLPETTSDSGISDAPESWKGKAVRSEGAFSNFHNPHCQTIPQSAVRRWATKVAHKCIHPRRGSLSSHAHPRCRGVQLSRDSDVSPNIWSWEAHKGSAEDNSNPSSGSEPLMRILIRYTDNFCNHTNTLYSGWQHGIPRHWKPSCMLREKSSQQTMKPGTLTLTHLEVGSGFLYGPPLVLLHSKICEHHYPGLVLSKAQVNCIKVPYKHKSKVCGLFRC